MKIGAAVNKIPLSCYVGRFTAKTSITNC